MWPRKWRSPTNWGKLARTVGENRAALDWQEQALRLARRLGDQAVIGRVLVHLSQQHLPQGHYQAAKACCEEAIALLTPLGAEGEVAIAHNNWGIACSEEGSMESALAHLVLAETMFEAQGNRRGQAKALHNQGEAYLRQERWAEAGTLYERSIAMALEAGDEVGAVRSRTSLAILLHQQGQHEAALDTASRDRERSTAAWVTGRCWPGSSTTRERSCSRWAGGMTPPWRTNRPPKCTWKSAISATPRPRCSTGLSSCWTEATRSRPRIGLQQTADLLAALPDPPSQLRQRYATLLGQAKANLAPVRGDPVRWNLLDGRMKADANGQLSRRTQ